MEIIIVIMKVPYWRTVRIIEDVNTCTVVLGLLHFCLCKNLCHYWDNMVWNSPFRRLSCSIPVTAHLQWCQKIPTSKQINICVWRKNSRKCKVGGRKERERERLYRYIHTCTCTWTIEDWVATIYCLAINCKERLIAQSVILSALSLSLPCKYEETYTNTFFLKLWG